MVEATTRSAAANQAVAELVDVCKVYGTGDTEVRALNGLSLKVNRGDYLAVMGTSGSGKSTAMNIIGCLDRPTSGSYKLKIGRASCRERV